jgi:hypothetical protein
LEKATDSLGAKSLLPSPIKPFAISGQIEYSAEEVSPEVGCRILKEEFLSTAE